MTTTIFAGCIIMCVVWLYYLLNAGSSHIVPAFAVVLFSCIAIMMIGYGAYECGVKAGAYGQMRGVYEMHIEDGDTIIMTNFIDQREVEK